MIGALFPSSFLRTASGPRSSLTLFCPMRKNKITVLASTVPAIILNNFGYSLWKRHMSNCTRTIKAQPKSTPWTFWSISLEDSQNKFNSMTKLKRKIPTDSGNFFIHTCNRNSCSQRSTVLKRGTSKTQNKDSRESSRTTTTRSST